MKRFVVTGLICVLFTLKAVAQEDSIPVKKPEFKPEWAFGVNGGITLSKISFNPPVSQDMLQQYVGGIVVRYISDKNVGLQAELNYSLRGWKERTDSVLTYSNIKGTLDSTMFYTNYSRSIAYLELPILTHIYFNMGKRSRVIFVLGPQISYYLNEKVIDSKEYFAFPFAPLVFPYPTPYHQMKVQRRLDWGIVGGLGYEFRTGIGSFVVDGRYYFGLSDVFSNNKGDFFQSSSNQIISVKMAYLFRL